MKGRVIPAFLFTKMQGLGIPEFQISDLIF